MYGRHTFFFFDIPHTLKDGNSSLAYEKNIFHCLKIFQFLNARFKMELSLLSNQSLK